MHQVCSKCVWEFVAFIIYLILPVKLTQGEEEIAVSPWCLLPEGQGTGALGPPCMNTEARPAAPCVLQRPGLWPKGWFSAIQAVMPSLLFRGVTPACP